MISPAVIVAALAFWAPYNGGQAPCAAGELQLRDAAPLVIAMQAAAGMRVAAYAPLGLGGCEIYVNWPAFTRLGPEVQCAVIAHELGHAFFGLEHTADRSNIMWEDTFTRPIPPVCAAVAVKPASHTTRRCRRREVKRGRHGFFDDHGGCVRHAPRRANAVVPQRRSGR